ncbi:YihY/virulence factor BrkB family protein [Paracoccus chinensis]|uniref:Membrane protein n=1 Tax=Paracoccus chinensis TaxID=525640 RepID=A0A1G9DLX6_9RHOB|nr:YihY/virulence factor BrkB family protein [Paracoccus chinensis]SDK64907.1 membrane protein [Paracoccus chinensis]
MTNPKPDVFEALFDPLPEGWRERKGLPPEPGKDHRTPAEQPEGRESAASTAKTAEANAAPPPRRPGAPESPWQLSGHSWLEVAKRVVKEFTADRVTSVAGGVTFFALLALFPAITALVSIYGMVADPATIADHLSLLENLLPQSALELISGQVIAIASAPKTSLSIAGIVAILVALWSANGGMKALIEALNIAWFETEKRGFIKLNLVSLAMTLGAIIGVILMIGLVAILPVLLNTLLAGSGFETWLNWLRWPILAGMLILGLAVIYRFGPSKEDAAWQWISPGALLATLGLLVASILFSWYAANFANYNETYGSLGAAVATMMWLWIAAIVVLMGAEVNSEVERQIKIENGVPPKSREDLDRA